MRILHVLDHSIPLHSGYTFRTLAILREQRRLGWETLQLTTPKQGSGSAARRRGRRPAPVCRTPGARRLPACWTQMRLTAARIAEVVQAEQPDLIHAHSPVLNALPALWVASPAAACRWSTRCGPPGRTPPSTMARTTEGSLRYRLSRALESFALRRADQVTTICDGLRARHRLARHRAPSASR